MKYQKRALWRLSLIVFAGLLLFCTKSNAQTVPQIAEKALASTVSLEMQDGNGVPLRFGSGFFVRPNLIATNYHVIAGASQGTAKLIGQDVTYTLEGITAIDTTNDLALLQIRLPHIHAILFDLQPFPLGDSDSVRIGDMVFVVDNPVDLEGVVSDAILISRRDKESRERFQMTAPISPSSSGGPVLNSKGEVIGVSVSTYQGLDVENLNFAIPSNYLKILLTHSGTAISFSQIGQTISAKTYLIQGYKKAKLGDYNEAIVEYTQAIRFKSDYANAYINRGIMKAALGQYVAAIADYNMAIRFKSDYANAYIKRGRAKAALGQYVAAIEDYDTAIRLEPNYANAYVNRGIAKIRLKQYVGGIEDYDTAIRLNPDYVNAYINRGIAKIRLKQYVGGIEDYDTAIRLNPDYVNAYINRGIASHQLGQHTAAMIYFDTAIRLNPGYANAYVNRGITKAALGLYAAAIADYNTAIRHKPDYVNAYINRGIAKIRLKQYAAAIVDYNTAIRLNPDYANVYYYRGLAKRSLANLWEAKQDLRSALKLAAQAGNQSLRAEIAEILQKWDRNP